jgi:hypothetical protein
VRFQWVYVVAMTRGADLKEFELFTFISAMVHKKLGFHIEFVPKMHWGFDDD